MLKELKRDVWQANLALPAHQLVTFTWGNVSGIDRRKGIVVIKPSGVSYEELTPECMVCVDLESGKVVEGTLKPSSDTPTHLELYRAFSELGGVVHTHSRWATSFAQAGKELLCLGTTHADHFYGTIPCTRSITPCEIAGSYEAETGKVIVEAFQTRSPMEIPAVLVKHHGPFTWGKDANEAVHHAVVLEEIAFTNFHTLALTKDVASIPQELLDKHYLRKHGSDAYYGQK